MKADIKYIPACFLTATSLMNIAQARAQSLEWSYEQYDPSPADHSPKAKGKSLAEVSAVEKRTDELATLSKLARQDAIPSNSDVAKSSAQKVMRPDIIDPDPGMASNGHRSSNAYGSIASPDQRNPLLNISDEEIRVLMEKLSTEKVKLSRMLSSRGHSQEEVLGQVRVINEQYATLNEARVKRILEQRKQKYLQQLAIKQKLAQRRLQQQSVSQPRNAGVNRSNPLGAEEAFSSGQ